MSDHYHYASEIQGAAADNHTHTPREIGAAEDHDLEMLRRELNSLGFDHRALEQRVQGLKTRNGELERQLAELSDEYAQLSSTLMEHLKNSATLMGQVEQIARRLVALEGGF